MLTVPKLPANCCRGLSTVKSASSSSLRWLQTQEAGPAALLGGGAEQNQSRPPAAMPRSTRSWKKLQQVPTGDGAANVGGKGTIVALAQQGNVRPN
jgi:hypothetical protein